MEEAYAEFERTGERRSVRMIAEYCKTGALVCYYDSDDKRWHITTESVQGKVKKIKALNERKYRRTSEKSSQNTTEELRTFQTTSESETIPDDKTRSEEQPDITKLRADVTRLSTLHDVNTKYIEKLEEERAQRDAQFFEVGKEVGGLKERVVHLQNENRRLLAAPPRQEAHTTGDNVQDAEFSEVKPNPIDEVI